MGKQKKGYLHSVNGMEYDVLLCLAEGRFSKSVKERSRFEKNAIIKYWQHKDDFTVDSGGDLLYNGRNVVKNDDISLHVSMYKRINWISCFGWMPIHREITFQVP